MKKFNTPLAAVLAAVALVSVAAAADRFADSATGAATVVGPFTTIQCGISICAENTYKDRSMNKIISSEVITGILGTPQPRRTQ